MFKIEKDHRLWKQIDGCSKYEISNYGKVRNFKTKKLLKTSNRNGYKTITLTNDKGVRVGLLIHRCVAMHFIDNPNPELFKNVLHIDNDRQNPHYSNLKWGTQSENIEHMYKTNKQVRENDNLAKGANHYLAKKVKMLSIDGVFIQEFESISLAVEFLISNNITDKKILNHL